MAKRRASRCLVFCATTLLLLVAASPDSPRIAAQGESDVEGTLEVHYEDSRAGARLQYYLDTGTERLALAFTRNPPRRLRTGARVRARGARRNRTLTLATGAAVSPLGGSSSGSSSQQLASSNTFGVQSTLVILFNFEDLVQEPYTPSSANTVTFNEVNHFFLENSFNQTSLNGTVVGWFTIPQSAMADGCDYNNWASAAEAAATSAGVNLGLYPRRVFGFPQTSACNWWGLGTIGGGDTPATPSRAWINGTYSLRVVAHEMGHNLGLYHSRSNMCDSASGCFVDEYGDDHDVMGGGAGSVIGHFNAYQKERLGWLNHGTSPSITNVNGPGQYALEPYATPWTGGSKALKIVRSTGTSNTYIYAEARTQFGVDAGLPPGIVIHTGNDTDGSQIYEEDVQPTAPAVDFILDPGQSITFSDAAPPVTIQALTATTTGATLQITQACVNALGFSGQSYGDTGGPGSVALTTGTNCPWTATSDSAWLTLNSGSASGTGSATIQFTVAANPGVARTGTLTIGGQTFTMTQAANACLFTVTPLNPSITHVAATYNLAVTATPSTCVWTPSSSAAWITLNTPGGTGDGVVSYTVTTNSPSHVARTGTLSLAGQTVTVRQEGLAGLFAVPANGATNVKTTNVTFAWSGQAGVQSYDLMIGTTFGAFDVYDSGEITTTTRIVPALPASRLLYARIRTRWDATTTTVQDIMFTTVDRISGLQVLGSQTPNPVVAGGSVQYGASAANSVKVSFTGSLGACTATFAATGLPTGVTATFSPASAPSSAPDQFTLLSVATTAATLPGSYTFTVTAQESAACGVATTTVTGVPLVVFGSTSLSTATATGTYGGSTAVSATLTAGGTPVSGKSVSFTLNGIAAGSATTDASGVATVASASLSGVNAGSFPTGVSASFAGDATYGAASGAGALTVSQKSVTPAITASSKVYDGTVSAALTSCTLTGVIGGDVVTCAGSATFASASAGVGKPVTASGLTLSGAGAPNYLLSTPTATTIATITARPVTPTVTAADKVFDGTTSATLTSCILTGVIGADVVSCTGTATFATATVGVGKVVTVTGLTLTGASAANYALTTPTATTTATISAAGGPTPVAAYAFNEGSGTSTTDASGTGNTGSITEATWTAAGKYGGALSFDGSASLVTIPDAPSLHLTTAMTLEAWVHPSTVIGWWADVIYKGDDTYYLEATSSSNAAPAAGGTWTSNQNLFGPTALAVNTWTHLAATYDGASLRLYVNGVQVASGARSGPLAPSTRPLQIGGDSIYGQNFAGLIDDVRVYNVALTAAQIQADMTTPVGAVAALPDLTVTKTHAGGFTQGQVGATYTVTVRNVGTGATSGAVTMVETVPSGLTATGLAGTGWSCTVATGTCTRSDALGAGASYPAVTVTVTVASAAPPSVTNQVTVSGGGDTTPSNNSASDPTTITAAGPTATTLSVATASGVYGGTSVVSATLSAGGSPVSGKTIAFTVQGIAVGTAVTNGSGVATVASASLGGVNAGSFPTGIGASFAGDATYGASSGTGALTVSQKSATPLITASNKAYDGNVSAALTSCTVSGVVGGDAVTCAAASSTFATSAVGTAKTVTASGITLGGAQAGNYSLATTTATTTANITAASVAPSVTAANKAYDGTTSATLSACTLSGVMGADAVTCSATSSTFATPAVGTGKTVTASGITLSGAQAGNYSLATTTATTTANITAASVAPSVTAANKAYDGTTSATLIGCTLTGVLGGDVVTCAAASASFATSAIGAGKAVTATGITLSGAQAGNYSLSATTATTTANITGTSVTPSVTAANKTYDGATSATLSACTLSGVMGADAVTCSATSSTFATPAVGTGKTVTASGITLSGAQAGNYSLATTTATTTANITAASVAPSVTAANKAYDGTTSATLSACALSGVMGADAVTCSAASTTFETPAVGTGKTVTASGITLSGAQAGNYSLATTTATTTANITAATVTPTVTAASKVYDGTVSAALTSCTLTGVIGGDVVACAGSATFASASAGVGKPVTASGLTLSGAAAANYLLSTPTATTSATITARPVTPTVTAADKVFDGTTSATLTSCTLTGVIGGDVVSCTGTATFASASVGTGKVVTVTGLTLTGASAANYALSTTTATTTATISAGGGPTPVAAYAFNEGSGTSTTDASGTGNTGSVTAGTWTAAGKYGSALSFDGSASLVTIPDAPSLHLTTAMTLEAWVHPSTVIGWWADVIYKGDDTYYLEATSSSNAAPAAGGTWTSNQNLFGPTALAVNTWTHLAATYDGVSLRLYVNGVQVASGARSGPLAPSTRPLQIGGDSIYGQNFAGLIDDVRVYNVALTAAQIQADMNTPVGAVAALPDLTVTKTHAGGFTQGQVGATYTVTVRNVGTGATSGAVTMVETVPSGLTATGLAGTGWSCTVATGTCTRSDALGAGASYPAVTVTVTIASAAPPSVTNQVTVSGGGDTTPANNSASDPTTITAAGPTVTTLSVATASGVYGGTSVVSATLSAGGSPVNGRTIAFTMNGVPVGSATTNASGVATVASASLSGVNAGTFPTGVGASFAGDATYGASSGTGALTVSQKSVTPSVTTGNKAYDGTTSATLTGCTLIGVIGGDVVTCVGSATFASASVGTGKLVTANAIALSGAGAANYSLTTTTATTTANITVATVTPSVTAANKAYDGTTSATLTGCTLTGVIGGDVVTCAAASASFATSAIGAGKAVTATGITLSGAQAGNYSLSATTATTTANITGTSLTPSVTAANKTYDGTMSATLSACTLSGVMGADAVTCSATSSTFATPAVGTGKTVTASGITLSGAQAGNYSLATTTATTTANITAASVAPSVTAAGKVYDGTTSATLTGCTLIGMIGGDVVTCTGDATFASASVGTGKPVNANAIALSGAGAANYSLTTTTATTTANITVATVTPSVTAANKTYDATTSATITGCTLSGVVGGEVITCSAASSTFATSSVGTGKTVTASGLTLSGAAGANYTLATTTATTTANITAAMVTPAVAAASKVYDGSVSAALTSCTLTGVIGGDVVTCNGSATFASATVGAGKAVTAGGLTLSGSAAANYALTTPTATTIATITARPVTPTVTAADKVFDGTTSATLTSCILTGMIGGDVVGCTGTATFASASVGTGKVVTVTGLTLTGASAANYALSTTTATTTATISAAGGPTPVAAYAFNEGSGTSTADASGTGNTGSITEATWTAAGKYGGALSFDGNGALVTIPDAPSLHLTTAMTLEVWVNPSTMIDWWSDVLYKGDDTYYLEAMSPAGAPVAGGTWASNQNLFGPSALPVNTWTHLAATYDGATVRLYVNGVQVASGARSGPLAPSTHPLQIGGDNIYGQYFAGLIDDVRVYNVALTATQIQADMNTPTVP